MQIRVPIPKSEDDLTLYFDEGVDNDGFGRLLDWSLPGLDKTARLADVYVKGVDLTEDGVTVHYVVEWRSSSAAGEFNRRLHGRTAGAYWDFDSGNAASNEI